MGKKDVLKIVALILALALVASTYGWWECGRKNERLLESIYVDSTRSQVFLSDMADSLNGSIKANASSDYLWSQLVLYDEHSIFLGKIFFNLYEQTGERKYYFIHTAAYNIAGFFTAALNDKPPQMQEMVKRNLKSLERIQECFGELLRYQKPNEIPESLAEELFNLSEELK
ncbi:hypothetical protein [Thermococcus sp. Bubb.Bath]|uniref:hypothetical protein n=1 Tax=Thermococcus sp. Bubb.Bath TaxID=1638242 RepID=UPI00197E3670|nr:hypothetical protein [Thermococcus sp. Bubb.Bath]